MSRLRRASLWLPSVAFMVTILAIAKPAATSVDLGHWDKLVHALAYGLFALANLRAFDGTLAAAGDARRGRKVLALALLLTLGFGAFDEWNQSRFPGRDASLDDWLADLVGALLALVVWAAAVRRRRRAA